MENVYVILSATPTMMGKIIRLFTKSSYNHSSISLTENWSEMYSFARYRVFNPLVGGFVKEFPQRLSLGKKRNVYIKVYQIPVSQKQFDDIKMFIYNIRDDEEQNIYNSMAVIGILLSCNFNNYKSYTCSDFVAQCLLKGSIDLGQKVSKNIIPDDMQRILDKYTYFIGSITDYTPIQEVSFDTKDFFEKTNLIKELSRTFKHFYNLMKRKNKMAN